MFESAAAAGGLRGQRISSLSIHPLSLALSSGYALLAQSSVPHPDHVGL